MTSPFNVLNETPSAPNMLAGAPENPVPQPIAYEEPSHGSVFDGAGGFDPSLPPEVGGAVGMRGVNIPMAAPATRDRFCCLTGPCQHYSEIHVDEADALPEPRIRVIRMCRLHLDDEGGHLEMSEGTVTACMTYSPPWWLPDGWIMKLLVARRLSKSLERISKVSRNHIWDKLVEWRVLPEENYGLE